MSIDPRNVSRFAAAGYVAGKPAIALRKRVMLYNVITYKQYVGWLAVTVGNTTRCQA